jgi:hypothetical protein
MVRKAIDVSEATAFPVPRDLTPEEEAAVIAQYKSDRTPEALEADYVDFEKQVAAGVPAEQLLNELRDDSSDE